MSCHSMSNPFLMIPFWTTLNKFASKYYPMGVIDINTKIPVGVLVPVPWLGWIFSTYYLLWEERKYDFLVLLYLCHSLNCTWSHLIPPFWCKSSSKQLTDTPSFYCGWQHSIIILVYLVQKSPNRKELKFNSESKNILHFLYVVPISAIFKGMCFLLTSYKILW